MLWLVLATSCGAPQSSPPPAAASVNRSSSAAPAGDEKPAAARQEVIDPAKLAADFLIAFRDGEPAALRPLACRTFQFRSTARVDACGGTASTPEEFGRLVRCVRSNATLQRELQYASGLASSVAAIPALPEWAVPLVTAHARIQPAAGAYINGDGVTYQFVLLSNQNCIEWLLLAADLETG